VVASADLAFLDACFHDASELPGRDMSQVPHPLVTDTVARLRGVLVQQQQQAGGSDSTGALGSAAGVGAGDPERLLARTHVVLVHMNHTNPLWREGCAQRAAVEAAGLHVGVQGASYDL
jgi:pyrroloquinoline quinone biosynthesis protein B